MKDIATGRYTACSVTGMRNGQAQNYKVTGTSNNKMAGGKKMRHVADLKSHQPNSMESWPLL